MAITIDLQQYCPSKGSLATWASVISSRAGTRTWCGRLITANWRVVVELSLDGGGQDQTRLDDAHFEVNLNRAASTFKLAIEIAFATCQCYRQQCSVGTMSTDCRRGTLRRCTLNEPLLLAERHCSILFLLSRHTDNRRQELSLFQSMKSSFILNFLH